MILSDREITSMFFEFFPGAEFKDQALINPASVDIRIGATLLFEVQDGWSDLNISNRTKENPYLLSPSDFVIVATYERLRVPNGYAVEMKLKSSRAREGYDHSLAFWFDPGWDGIGTMEIKNNLRYNILPLYYGMPFAQIIIHRLTSDSIRPYSGKYQNAKVAESSKG